MNLFDEDKNFRLKESKVKKRISIDILANFPNKDSISFAQSNRYFPTISTAANKNMDIQDLSSKVRTRSKREQVEGDEADKSVMNIRKYFDPMIYQMLLNP